MDDKQRRPTPGNRPDGRTWALSPAMERRNADPDHGHGGGRGAGASHRNPEVLESVSEAIQRTYR